MARLRERGGFAPGPVAAAAAAAAGRPARPERRPEPAELLLGFLDDPPRFDLRNASDPGSTSPAEIGERRREVEYRIRWLEALLELSREELEGLRQAEQAPRTPSGPERGAHR